VRTAGAGGRSSDVPFRCWLRLLETVSFTRFGFHFPTRPSTGSVVRAGAVRVPQWTEANLLGIPERRLGPVSGNQHHGYKPTFEELLFPFGKHYGVRRDVSPKPASGRPFAAKWVTVPSGTAFSALRGHGFPYGLRSAGDLITDVGVRSQAPV